MILNKLTQLIKVYFVKNRGSRTIKKRNESLLLIASLNSLKALSKYLFDMLSISIRSDDPHTTNVKALLKFFKKLFKVARGNKFCK